MLLCFKREGIIMIEHDYHDEAYEVTCDKCDYYAIYDTEKDFYKLIECLKRDGWKIKKTKNRWQHYCYECNEKEKTKCFR
jgi:uncharacterized protein YjhX (UPF0386 family)